MSREEDHREVRTLGDDDSLHGLPCGDDEGRHDDTKPGDAQESDLLCTPRKVSGISRSHAARERILHTVP